MQPGEEKLLLTAGPSPISSVTRKILSGPVIYHRSAEFIQTFDRVSQGMKYLFQTDHDIIILTASGTGGMEATITNLFSPGESILVVENGKFSERWSHIAGIFGLDVRRIKVPWGKSVNVTEISNAIQDIPSLKAIFLTHCETSTGALTDLEPITTVIRKFTDSLIIVDAISSAGVLPLKMDKWHIDVAITASQKGLGLPPGLTFVALNKRVWQYAELAELPRYYFDFIQARQAYRSERGAVFTPAIPLVLAVDAALKEIQTIGLEQIWRARHQIALNFRQKLIHTGFSIFPEIPADALTVIRMANPLDTEKIISRLDQEHGIRVSNGQGQLLNKVIRIGHFANIEMEQLDHFLTALTAVVNR